MNIREDSTIRAPSGKDEVCAKFTIDDTSTPFVLHGITLTGQEYTLGFYALSESAGSITVDGELTSTSDSWTRCEITFIASDEDVAIYFNTAGTYYLYHTQLEIGCKATDFEAAPEDVDDKFDDYATIARMTAEIELAKDSISLSVAETYATQDDLTDVEDRVLDAEARIELNAENIELRVEKDGVISAINQSAESVTIAAEHLDLTGYVTISSLANPGETVIDGSNIATGKIDAARIDTETLFAQEITATNMHITGNSTFDGELDGATGTFSGDVYAMGLTVDNTVKIRYDTGDYIALNTLYDELEGMLAIGEDFAEIYLMQPTVIYGGLSVYSGGLFGASLQIDRDGCFGSTLYVGSTLIAAGTISSDSTITAGTGFCVGTTRYNNGYVELYSSGSPLIDFHYQGSPADYTSRIIESGSGVLSVNGTQFDLGSGDVTVKGAIKSVDYSGSTRRPASSAVTDGTRVSYISSNVRSSDTTYYLKVGGQYGTEGSTYFAYNYLSTTSDARLKTNVDDTQTEALTLLNEIQIRQFDWLQTGSHQKIGFVADELELLDPGLAIGGGCDEDGNMDIKIVNTFYLMGYVVKGIQELCDVQLEQADQIATVESRLIDQTLLVNQLLDENAELKKRIAQLEEQLAA